MSKLPLLLLLSFVALGVSEAAEKTYRLTVNAGDWDRKDTVVSFSLPAWQSGASVKFLQGEGRTIPLQIDGHGHASFVEPNLKKGNSKTYDELTPANARLSSDAMIQVNREGRVLKISSAGHPILQYQAEPSELPRPNIKPIFRRGGYLHPLYTPSGKIITDDYPTNHLHHHGVWFTWTKTEFEGRGPDFWNMGEGKGTVEFVALDRTWSGPVHGGFQTRHRFVDLTSGQPKPVLNETWDVKIFQRGEQRAYWMFDLTSTQECATAEALKLPNYYYGGLGFRGREEWNGADKTFYLTSDGETDRVKGNTTRGRWCHISGQVDGSRTGIAVLGHPDNFRAPQPMRLHPTEPFFCFAPSQLGDWEIAPGKPYVSRFRFIVRDGPSDAAELDRLWNDFAHPPEVKIEER